MRGVIHPISLETNLMLIVDCPLCERPAPLLENYEEDPPDA